MVAGKVCKKCLVWKEFGEFLKHPNCKTDGHKGTCKDCEKLYKKEYFKKNKEEMLIKQKERYERVKDTPEYKATVKSYRQENKGKSNKRAKERRKENPERYKEREAKYRAKNKEKILEYHRQWKLENKEHLEKYKDENKEAMTEYNKRYWIENQEKKKEEVSKWRKENAEHIKMYRVANRERDKKKAQEWHASEKGKILRATMTNRYRAKKKLLKHDFTPDDWVSCMEHFCYQCAYCGHERKLEQEHVIPVTKGGTFTKNNIVPACRNCNVTKSNRDFGEWYKSQKHYSPEREKKILLYLGKEVSDDSLQVLAHRNRKDTQNINDSNR